MHQDMESNRQNNMHWKEKLQDENAFARGELQGTDAVWNKLYERMHQPQRKKKMWYWIAASVVVTVLLSIVFLSEPKRNNSNVVKAVPLIQTEKRKVNQQEEWVISLPVEKASTVTHVKQQKEIKQKATEKKIHPVPVAVAEEPAVSTEILSPFEIKEDSTKAVAVSLAVAKQRSKLKVIHVNELGDNRDTRYKQESDFSVIQFGVRSQPVNNITSPGIIGLRISTNKTSPSN